MKDKAMYERVARDYSGATIDEADKLYRTRVQKEGPGKYLINRKLNKYLRVDADATKRYLRFLGPAGWGLLGG